VGKRGASPLSVKSPLPLEILRESSKEGSREAKPLLDNTVPHPPNKGKGDKGGWG